MQEAALTMWPVLTNPLSRNLVDCSSCNIHLKTQFIGQWKVLI